MHTPIEALILEMAEERGAGKTLCPSEVAKRLDPQRWRARSGAIRAAVTRLAAAGRLRVTQRGRNVDARTARGPIRIGKP